MTASDEFPSPEPKKNASLEISRHGGSLFVSWPLATDHSLRMTENPGGEWTRVPNSRNRPARAYLCRIKAMYSLRLC